jgi:hypothetical protein
MVRLATPNGRDDQRHGPGDAVWVRSPGLKENRLVSSGGWGDQRHTDQLRRTGPENRREG